MDKQVSAKIKYVNVEASQALNDFLQTHITSLLSRVAKHRRKYSVFFTIKSNAKDDDSKITSFEVDGTFVIARHANFHASEKMKDVNKAIVAVSKSLEKQIRRLTEKQESSRRTIGHSMKSVRKFKEEAFS